MAEYLWIRILESTDRRSIRQYWRRSILQSELSQASEEYKLAGHANVNVEQLEHCMMQRGGAYSLGRGRLDYIIPEYNIKTVAEAIEYIKHQHHVNDPCIALEIRKKGLTVIGGWTVASYPYSITRLTSPTLPDGLMWT